MDGTFLKFFMENSRIKLDDKTREYKDKIEFLRGDFEKSERDKKDIEARKVAVKLKEKKAIQQEEKNIQESQKISLREINVKRKEEQIKLEIKKRGLDV